MEKWYRHYGWIVVIGCAFIYFYGVGLSVNTLSLFMLPVIEIAELTKTEGSSMVIVQYAMGLVGLVLAESFYKRFSVRKGVLLFGIMIGAGYCVFAAAQTLWGCYIAMALIGLGYGGGSMIPSAVLVTRWFREKRGLALGISACGSGIATVVFPPIVESIIEDNSFAAAAVFQGVSIGIIVFITVLLIRDYPSQKGLLPFGETEAQHAAELEAEVQKRHTDSAKICKIAEFSAQLKDKRFVTEVIGVTLAGMASIPTITYMAMYYTSSGYKAMFAASMISIFGIVMLFGKPLFGEILDKFGTKKGNIYIYLISVLSMLTGALLPYDRIFAYLFSIFMGLGAVLSPMAIPVWAADLFGKGNYTQMYTYLRICFTLGGTISLILPGICADYTGMYTPVLYLYCALYLVSSILIHSLYRARAGIKSI